SQSATMAKACRATTPAGRISATWRPTSVIPSSAGLRPTGPRAYRASSPSPERVRAKPPAHRRHFLSIRDDGEGVPRDNAGRPDFRYVATHICDSVKRRLKADGTSGLQGEFGIGLLSFWTVGDELSITSTGDDRRAYQMVMRKGDPTYVVRPMRL